jgi:HK97 family phage major capsid protein
MVTTIKIQKKMSKISVNTMTRAAGVADGQVNVENRTVQVTFATETPVMRFDWRNDRYFWEVLGFGENEADITRFAGAAPVLDNHNAYNGARGTLGVVENATLNGNNGTATLRFSKREDVEPIFQDVVDGIIRTVSVGYVVKQYKDTGRKGENGYPIFRATQWEAREISLAPIAADPMSRVRSEDAPRIDVDFEAVTPPAADPAPAQDNAQRSAAEASGVVPVVTKPQKRQKMKDVNQMKAQRKVLTDELAALDVLGRSESGLVDENANRQTALVEEIRTLDGQIASEEQRLAILAARAAGGAGASASDAVEKRTMAKRATITEAVLRSIDGKQLDGIIGEMTQEAQRQGLSQGGSISIPTDFIHALRSGTADNFQIDAGQGSAFKPTEVPSFIEKLFAPFVFERAGATVLTNLVGKQQFPRQNTHGTAAAQTEVGATSNAGIELGELVMDARRYTAKTTYSKKLMVQSPLSADAIIARILRAGFERKIEFDGFLGATGGQNIVGIFNQAGVNNPTIIDGSDHAAVAAALYAASLAGEADLGASTWVGSPRAWECFQGAAQVADVSPLLSANNTVHGRPMIATPYLTNAAQKGRLVFGDFSHALFGYWGAFDLVIDPYSLAETNQIKLVGNMYVDLGLSQPAAFSVTDDLALT